MVNMNVRRIAVTGASGKTGRAVVQALVNCGATVRALARRSEQVGALRAIGASEVIVGDVGDSALLSGLLEGADAVYAIFPNMHAGEEALGASMIAAAQRRGGVRVVYHSVLHPQIEAMPHHWSKLRVEERLFSSGLRCTVLQPAAYMQNVLAWREAIVGCGRLPVPYAAATRIGLVDLNDVAAAAATVLCSEDHDGATYELAGPEVLNQDEVASSLGQALGSPVQVEEQDRTMWAQQARGAGMADYAVDSLMRMFEFYERFGFWGNPKVLHMLLGRQPTSFTEFARREFGDAGREASGRAL
jgi:uncharacterized protein YbjT (DUF2867 family)